jgi:uncharacterized protein (DUF952 family)
VILHIADAAELEAARANGDYVPTGFARDGFIHLSTPEQVHLPANALFSRRRDLVLLWVDPTRLRAELRYELPAPGAPESFPHLYGPLNLDAVVRELPLEPWEPREFRLPD